MMEKRMSHLLITIRTAQWWLEDEFLHVLGEENLPFSDPTFGTRNISGTYLHFFGGTCLWLQLAPPENERIGHLKGTNSPERK